MTNKQNLTAAPRRGVRRWIGLMLLTAIHLAYLTWCGAMAIFTRRYRRLFPFQARYFRDVLAGELRRSKDHKP